MIDLFAGFGWDGMGWDGMYWWYDNVGGTRNVSTTNAIVKRERRKGLWVSHLNSSSLKRSLSLSLPISFDDQATAALGVS